MKDIIIYIAHCLNRINERKTIIFFLSLFVLLVSLFGKHNGWALTTILILYSLYDEIKQLIRRIKELPFGVKLQDSTPEDIKQSNTEFDKSEIFDNIKEKLKKQMPQTRNINYNLMINEAIFSKLYEETKIDREKKLVSDNLHFVFDGKYLDSRSGSVCFIEIKLLKNNIPYNIVNKMLQLINLYSLTIQTNVRLDLILCGDINDSQKKCLENQFEYYIENGKLKIVYITLDTLDQYIKEYTTITR